MLWFSTHFMEIKIVAESENYLVINKPAGVVVNRAESVGTETVQDWSEKTLNFNPPVGGSKSQNADEELYRKRSGICHRLDKETTGCLLIAKNPSALSWALKSFANRTVHKEYLALVHGRMEPQKGHVKLPLARDRRDREKFEIHYSGKMAETEWQVEKIYQRTGISDQGPVSLVRLFPKTGRTHQIRVHLSHLGYPIWSDERYLRKDYLVEDRKQLDHHFLHAARISLTGPDKEVFEVECGLTEDEIKLISLIGGE